MCWPRGVRTVVDQALLSPFGEFSKYKMTRLVRYILLNFLKKQFLFTYE